ncbi:hypothetical protein E2C01_040643 [Portunus trituberculatus]|uniref:Uncharacterized protein n=1 Tax=Portunus trituberculatus TaxID=210409 RepID=A0A5B7FKC0_PORTR|nr:hypothetical protein [Portunus trituberculatus]
MFRNVFSRNRSVVPRVTEWGDQVARVGTPLLYISSLPVRRQAPPVRHFVTVTEIRIAIVTRVNSDEISSLLCVLVNHISPFTRKAQEQWHDSCSREHRGASRDRLP